MHSLNRQICSLPVLVLDEEVRTRPDHLLVGDEELLGRRLVLVQRDLLLHVEGLLPEHLLDVARLLHCERLLEPDLLLEGFVLDEVAAEAGQADDRYQPSCLEIATKTKFLAPDARCCHFRCQEDQL